ncbi:MAG: hypothetical protein R2741_09495 [Methanolobus sp.]
MGYRIQPVWAVTLPDVDLTLKNTQISVTLDTGCGEDNMKSMLKFMDRVSQEHGRVKTIPEPVIPKKK